MKLHAASHERGKKCNGRPAARARRSGQRARDHIYGIGAALCTGAQAWGIAGACVWRSTQGCVHRGVEGDLCGRTSCAARSFWKE